MSCDEVKINDDINEITIINNEDKFDVADKDNITTIIDNKDVFEVTEQVADTVVINLTDVRVIPPQNVDVAMNCTAAEQIGDAVYVFADGEVRRANNSDISTARVMGFVVTKPTTTSCTVRVIGTIDTFVGLTPGSQYFLDNNDGAITLVAPSASGSVLVRLGQATEDVNFLINVNNNYIIRS